MKCKILHESSGRIRLRAEMRRMTMEEADQLEAYLAALPGVRQATVYERTCDMVILYREGRKQVLDGVAAFRFDREAMVASTPENSGRALNRQYQERLVNMVLFRAARVLFLPTPLQQLYTLFRSVRYLWHGARCLLRRKLEVEVLDALSIGVSIVRNDYSTAASVMFLLRLGELLEEWTRKKSLGDLARCMSLNVDRVWLKRSDTEVLVPITQVKVGDTICVHTGNVIPLDGRVLSGEACVNQASLTGESLAVRKAEGACVYAGTVVEEGECVILVEQQSGSGRYGQIVSMIEESEKLKSSTENRALALADRLVPYSLAGTALTYLLTRNATRAISILMVDFSCALKLSMPLAVLSAMRECGSYHITVKGGKYLEAMAKADTIVFDKTGTLAGVICVADPLREEASAVLNSLRKLGISKAVMMTGDNERTAAVIAKEVGVDEYFAEVLPEDKARFVEQEKAAGRTVVMIGDGINDSPALSAADVGIAISDGAAIAREIADITIAADDLFELVLLKMTANGLLKRTDGNYRFVLGFNGTLIVLGAAGILPPATSALLHNLSTLGISIRSMTNLLD